MRPMKTATKKNATRNAANTVQRSLVGLTGGSTVVLDPGILDVKFGLFGSFLLVP